MRITQRTKFGRLAVALAVALALAGSALPVAAAQTTQAAQLAAPQTMIDSMVQAGYEEPAPVLAALKAALSKQAPGTPEARMLRLGEGLVAAGAALDADTTAALAALDALGSDPLAQADSALVRATLADSQGDSAAAAQAAQAALDIYQRLCPAQAGCDYRSSWRALQLLARHLDRRGRSSAARERAVEAVAMARSAGDRPREAWALAVAADIRNADDSLADDQRLLDQALQLAQQEGTPALLARVRVYETRMLVRAGNLARARQAAEAGLALSRQAAAPRLGAVFQANLADLHVKAGRPKLALQAVEAALPVVRRFNDKRAERVLLNYAALARVVLGDIKLARKVLDELLWAHRASGSAATEAEALREFADAFAAAGDLPLALELYHRERNLAAEIMATNRDLALAELRTRFDREAQQRKLDQLARENALITVQIDNRAATIKVWVASAVLLALAMAAVALLYRRVRAVNRNLAHNQAFLLALSQRDPLTGLANRRALHERAATQQLEQAFVGALLLIDIDHFKHVNDGHGHAAGDQVLVEVSRRLTEAVREGDLLVRWGGEEFLVYMPGASSTQAQALADRALRAVGGTPVALGAAGAAGASGSSSLRVTVSVGYAGFPLPPWHLPLNLERAINLADMALYTAKNQGRNRAIGVAGVLADEPESLRRIEADFDQAWRSSEVSLLHTLGPVAPSEADAAAALARSA